MVSDTEHKSILNWIIPAAFSMALIFSSDSLTILGNAAGMAGNSFLFYLAVSFIIYFATVLSYREMFTGFIGHGAEVNYMGAVLGRIPVILLPLLSRVMFTVCASAGLLATAGYVFNEIFVYWLPNMGFSFCLLGLILLTGLLGRRIIFGVQIVSVGITLLGLFFLLLWGLFIGEAPAVTELQIEAVSFNPLSAGLSGLVLFMGIDLALFAPFPERVQPTIPVRPMLLSIIVSVIILSLWSIVSGNFAAPEKLAETSVPYAIVARAIMGETGRKIMGLVIILGACGAVNALLVCVSRMMAAMGEQGLLPSVLLFPKREPTVPFILLVLAVAAMLASGMAGEPVLGVMARSGVFFWLLTYSAIHISVLTINIQKSDKTELISKSWNLLFPVFGFITTCLGAFLVVWFEPDSILLGKVILASLTVVLLFSIIWVLYKSKRYNY
ncbi:APC family permease [Thermodesulfobacteriota bacterium]